MRFSLQVRYAICGVFDLAYNGHGDPIQVRAISARQVIPVRYLEQIFQRLRRAGIVGSKRGPGGGYSLARGAAELTLRHIVEAVEGSLAETLDLEPGEADEAGGFDHGGIPVSRRGARADTARELSGADVLHLSFGHFPF